MRWSGAASTRRGPHPTDLSRPPTLTQRDSAILRRGTLSATHALRAPSAFMMLSAVDVTIVFVDEPADDDQETVSSWTNRYTAEYKRRQAMLTAMRPFEVIAMLRDLNLTSYAFSKNAEELQAHVAQ